jgi:hypothetical protein
MDVPLTCVSGTPNDSPTWTYFGGATSNNLVSVVVDAYPQISQRLVFTGAGSYVNSAITNSYPSTTCTLSVSVYPETATSVSIKMGTGSITQDLTTGSWNPINFQFNSGTAGTNNLQVGPFLNAGATAAEVGTLQTTNWTISTGANLPRTVIRGNLWVPFGQIHTDDILTPLGTLNEALALREYSTATLNSSTWTTIYTIPSGNHGFIKVNCGTAATVSSMTTAYFEYTGKSYPSLTLIAQSGNAFQGTLNTTNAATGGVVQITLQRSGNNIQAKSVPASLPIAVRFTFF